MRGTQQASQAKVGGSQAWKKGGRSHALGGGRGKGSQAWAGAAGRGNQAWTSDGRAWAGWHPGRGMHREPDGRFCGTDGMPAQCCKVQGLKRALGVAKSRVEARGAERAYKVLTNESKRHEVQSMLTRSRGKRCRACLQGSRNSSYYITLAADVAAAVGTQTAAD
eukprot:357983-Chlamydomonas_euryale.AAC.2